MHNIEFHLYTIPKLNGTILSNNMSDIGVWGMLTDLAPHQQCASLVLRLQGQARALADTMTPQEMAIGTIRDGVPIDPATLLI